MYLALDTIAKLLAPFCPFFAEELFSHINPGAESVHLHPWPTLFLTPLGVTPAEPATAFGGVLQVNIAASQTEVQEARRTGEMVKEIIANVRHYKSEQRIALNARMEGVYVYVNRDMSHGALDISNALNADIEFRRGKPDIHELITEIRPNLSSLGPRFKSQAKQVTELIKSIPSEELANQIVQGSVTIKGYEFEPTDFIVKKELFAEGVVVDVIELSEGIILVKRV